MPAAVRRRPPSLYAEASRNRRPRGFGVLELVAVAILLFVSYHAADDRYDHMQYRHTGRWGLKLPAVSLGLWHNFGADRPLESGRAILRRAFDLGVTHFDLANNYGPPYGSAEETFGRILDKSFRLY